jgi:hypothetical protein
VLYLIPSPVFDGRLGGLGYRGFGEEVDAVFLPKIAEPTEVSCFTLQGRRSPGVRHIDEAHTIEHQKLYIAGRPGKLPFQDGKGKRVISGGYWCPIVALTSLFLEGFPHLYALWVVLIFTG